MKNKKQLYNIVWKTHDNAAGNIIYIYTYIWLLFNRNKNKIIMPLRCDNPTIKINVHCYDFKTVKQIIHIHMTYIV